MRILFIGGTGVISSACSQRAINQGHDLTLVNRGQTDSLLTGDHKVILGDINSDQVQQELIGAEFDVVVDWICFNQYDVERDIRLFSNSTDQFIFISSASVYEKPPSRLPITEEAPLDNPYWDYSQKKIACELRFLQEYQNSGFPVTIVRPSHTYGPSFVPLPGRYTLVDRMKRGKKVIVHGDGTSLWTLTFNEDFAVGFNGLMGNSEAIGESFHITSDEWLNWNQIFAMTAEAFKLGSEFIHIPSEFIYGVDQSYGAGLLGDKAQSAIFDNSKLRAFVPEFNPKVTFKEGVKRVAEWHADHPEECIVDPVRDQLIDRIIATYKHGS